MDPNNLRKEEIRGHHNINRISFSHMEADQGYQNMMVGMEVKRIASLDRNV